MIATMSPRKKPAGSDPEKQSSTRHVRINPDLVEMLADIVELTGQTTARYLDPLIREHIEADYKAKLADITLMKKVREKHRRDQE